MSPGATIAPQLQISASLEQPESLQVPRYNTRAIKALSFCIKSTTVAGICQGKRKPIILHIVEKKLHKELST